MREYLEKYYDGDIEEALAKVESGLPVQYVVGNVDFYGYNFLVNENVLIPRFETEGLVEKTLFYINKYFDNPSIVDIGTGSGCIAVTLSLKLGVCVDAVDVSSGAIDVAKKNCINNCASVNFYLGSLFEPLNSRYDVIISNPPYIAYDEKIDDVVKNNEPHLALYASDNGLYFYKEILSNCSKYLNEKSLIAFEIGCTQGDSVKELAEYYLPNSRVFIEKDLSGRDRYVFIFNEIM